MQKAIEHGHLEFGKTNSLLLNMAIGLVDLFIKNGDVPLLLLW